MDTSNIITYVTLIISIGAVVIGVVNHKKVTSRCCDRKASFSLDIETNQSNSPVPQVPQVPVVPQVPDIPIVINELNKNNINE